MMMQLSVPGEPSPKFLYRSGRPSLHKNDSPSNDWKCKVNVSYRTRFQQTFFPWIFLLSSAMWQACPMYGGFYKMQYLGIPHNLHTVRAYGGNYWFFPSAFHNNNNNKHTKDALWPSATCIQWKSTSNTGVLPCEIKTIIFAQQTPRDKCVFGGVYTEIQDGTMIFGRTVRCLVI